MNLFTTNIPSFPAGLRVLAVDDDTNVLYAIHHICNRLRYQVTTCCTISRAMEHLFRQDFDIILIETHIPQQNTYAFVQQMTSLLKIPVIMMSLDNRPCSVMNSISNGACSYWTKPLDENLFKNMWQHVLRKALSQSDPHELEAKGLKKRGRDDHLEAKGLKKRGRDDDLEAKGLTKQGRDDDDDDVEVSKQPLAKKTRLSWTLDLHQKFLSAVNHLGINNAMPKKILKIMDCPGLTSGHVASHLQKYRQKCLKKSKLNEFEFQGHKNCETQYSMTAQDQCHDKSLAEKHSTEIDFELQGQKNNETQYSMTAQDQCHDKSPAEQHCTEIDFDFQGQKNNETQYSMTMAQDQCHDKSPAEQHWTDIDESDIFFSLTDLFPDLNDDIHNVMS